VQVPAHLDHVGSGINLAARQRVCRGTVEHLLAVLHSYGITNLLVKVQGEIPILDGSAIEFCNLIDEAGVREETEEGSEIVVDRQYRIGSQGGESISIEPAEVFSVHYVLNYQSPWVSKMSTPTKILALKEEIAPSENFWLSQDIESYNKQA
jgi:UDP-3-O-acyl-N-acetylglucosamine deacetylase